MSSFAPDMKRLLTRVLCTVFIAVFGQMYAQRVENLRLMTYNVLSYRTANGQCTGNNNNPTSKDGYIKTVVQYIDPDIIVMNEIGAQPVNSDRLLTNALNVGGINKWEQANYSSNGWSNLVNMLFYDSTKVGLHSQRLIDKDLQNQSLVRAIDLYRLYYKDPLLHLGGDTVYFVVVALHLKAGNSNTDENDRDDATAALIDLLKTQVADEHVFICGDFNSYNANEGGIQNLVTASPPSERFFDPINKLGGWNNSPIYAAIHTQSTRNSGNTNSGCFSGGGLDDRFDMILVSDAVLNDAGSEVNYTDGSYEVLGNDGSHFNKGITDIPTNGSAPSVVIDALSDNSDHLPVYLEFDVHKQSLATSNIPPPFSGLRIHAAAAERLVVQMRSQTSESIQLRVVDLLGRKLIERPFELHKGTSGKVEIEFPYQKGIYILQLQGVGWATTERFQWL